MIMVDDWDEDNELALLEPALEKAGSGSTSTSFAYSIFGSHFGGATFRNGALRKMKMILLFRGDGLMNEFELSFFNQ